MLHLVDDAVDFLGQSQISGCTSIPSAFHLKNGAAKSQAPLSTDFINTCIAFYCIAFYFDARGLFSSRTRNTVKAPMSTRRRLLRCDLWFGVPIDNSRHCQGGNAMVKIARIWSERKGNNETIFCSGSSLSFFAQAVQCAANVGVFRQSHSARLRPNSPAWLMLEKPRYVSAHSSRTWVSFKTSQPRLKPITEAPCKWRPPNSQHVEPHTSI